MDKKLLPLTLFLGVVLILISLFFALKTDETIEKQESTQQTKPNSTLTEIVDIPPEVRDTDIKASFAVYTNGTFRIFTASMYHNRSEDVYIDPANPNEVNVKKAGVTWSDFFTTLPFSLDKDCLTTGTGQEFCTNGTNKLRFYLNGNELPNALERIIHENDRLLVTYGPGDIDEQVLKLDSL